MGFDGIIDILGVVAKHWTPEKIKARARQKLSKLKEEEREILSKESTPKNSARLAVVRRNIKRLSDFFQAQ